MKRKLIKQGVGGSLTLYVPKKWIDLLIPKLFNAYQKYLKT